MASDADRIISLYERHAADFDKERGKNLFERGWLDLFLSCLDGTRVLDVGCGSGEPIADYLISRTCAVTGVDSSEPMIAMCRERFPGHVWQVADMRLLDLGALLAEIDGLLAQGVTYLYFIDEIFLPNAELVAALAQRDVRFGVQTRIDLWKPDMLDALGAAGCVSIEAGVESLSAEGRDALAKRCRMTTDELAERLIHARRTVPFVQANLIKMAGDNADQIAAWRQRLERHGVWANDPVPLYPYPSSPDYHRLWGKPDDSAWERAHAHYLAQFREFSDIQDERPRPLSELEASCCRN